MLHMFKTEHNWELKVNTAERVDFAHHSVFRTETVPRRKTWVCKNCAAVIITTVAQERSNSFGKPSRKRKIDGLYCGERIIGGIIES